MKDLDIPKEGSLIKLTRVVGDEHVVVYDIVTKIRYYSIGNTNFPIAFYTTTERTVPLPFQGINFFYKIIQ